MIRRTLQLFTFTGLLALTGSACADPYNLQLSGTILSRTCDVDSQMQTVPVGQFATTDFTAAGSVSAAKAFDINLTGCGSAASGAEISFSGTSDAENPALLALSDIGDAAGMASGVGVEILDGQHQAVAINHTMPLVYAIMPGDNTLSFYLRYKATRDVVTPGNATAVMYFDLQYQ